MAAGAVAPLPKRAARGGRARRDVLCPIRKAVARSRDALVQLGYAVEWHSYPMAHQVCAEEIADLRQWIGARLA